MPSGEIRGAFSYIWSGCSG